MSEPNQVVALTEGITAGAFHEILDLAIEGRGKLPGAKQSAKQLLLAKNDAEDAIARMVTSHVAMASGQGFATNWGGFSVSVVMSWMRGTLAAMRDCRQGMAKTTTAMMSAAKAAAKPRRGPPGRATKMPITARINVAIAP